MKRYPPRSAAPALTLALALISGACGGAGDPAVPVAVLDDAEPLVRERIEEAVGEVRETPDSVSKWGRLGEIYDAHRYVAQALPCYQRAQELEPEQWRWPYFAGLALRDGDSAAAQRDLARAAELRPDYAPVWFILGFGALQDEDLDGAEVYFRRALEVDPGLVNGSLGLARVALARGDRAAALELVEKAARQGPDEAGVHEQRAQILRLLGDETGAAQAEQTAGNSAKAPSVLGFATLSDPVREQMFLREGVSSLWLRRRADSNLTPAARDSLVRDLRRAIEIEPDRIDSRITLARVLAREGLLDEARREVDRALELHPEDAESHAALGNLLIRSGGAPAAVRAYRRALELEPDLHEARAQLGALLVEGGLFEEGIELLRAASRVLPGNADAQHNLAAALVQTGRPAEAMPILVELLERRPRYAPALTLLGTVQALRGELDESVTSLTRAVEADPNDADARIELGRSLWELGRYGEAIEALTRAARDRSDDPELARELAWALATCPSADWRDGRKALEMARQICERSAFGNPIHLDLLAAAQAETGDFDGASRSLGRALEIVERTRAGLDPRDGTREALDEYGRELRQRLELYRSGIPYRQKG